MTEEGKLALKRESQHPHKRLAELDKSQKRHLATVSDLKGIQDITTSLSKGIRSIPGRQGRYYLDLYLQQKERERLVKEMAWIKRRELRIGQKIAEVDKEIANKEEMAVQSMVILSPEAVAEDEERPQEPKEFKTMTLDY